MPATDAGTLLDSFERRNRDELNADENTKVIRPYLAQLSALILIAISEEGNEIGRICVIRANHSSSEVHPAAFPSLQLCRKWLLLKQLRSSSSPASPAIRRGFGCGRDQLQVPRPQEIIDPRSQLGRDLHLQSLRPEEHMGAVGQRQQEL